MSSVLENFFPAPSTPLNRPPFTARSNAYVLATLRADPVTTAPGVADAATAHVRLLAQRLGLLNEQVRSADRSLADLLGKLTASEEPAAGQPAEQRDAEILASLPGVGPCASAAIRTDADRLLAVSCAMLREGELFDPHRAAPAS